MFEEDIQDFILSRVGTLVENSDNWFEYEQENNIASENSKKIIEKLGKKQELFFNYENSRSKISYLEQVESYRKGFSDSFNLFLKLYKSK